MSNKPIGQLLKELKERNDRENRGVLDQVMLSAETIPQSKVLASLSPGKYLPISNMLEDRFRFAGRWTNATLAFTWLSLADMEGAWNDSLVQEAIALRQQNWPTSVLNQHPFEKLALFAIDADDGNEIYLVFGGKDEPEIVSYFGAQEKSYADLRGYLVAQLGK